MTTRLDQKIQQLEDMVERHLNLCRATRPGGRCVLPAGHPLATAHEFNTCAPPTERSAARKLIEEICNGGWVIGRPA